MTVSSATPLDDLRAALLDSAAELRSDPSALSTAPTLERPPRAELGDYSTNAAMLLAPVLKAAPRAIAERLGSGLDARMGDRLDRVEVAGPGFLNVFLTDAWYVESAASVLAAGEEYGAGRPERSERINVEFVSANPTGPLTAASGRHAAYGDSLSRILELAGHSVDREYYFNDSGTQVRKLGESIRARALGGPVPAGGYEGDYVVELAAAIPGAGDKSPDLDRLSREGVERMFARIRRTLETYRVSFDRFFLENSLYEGEPTAVERAYARLEERGHLYRHEGALWLRTSDFGDDKDRVLERSTGDPTYFASDVAYLEHKLERGYDRLVYVLGSDHHGYIGRMRAAAAALGVEPRRLEIPILQFVHIVEGGQRASMSKRRGDFITLDELVEEIGVDATRFFMLGRSHDSTVDLDLDLARRQSNENPVYYVQYAHARIASVLARAGQARVEQALLESARAEGLTLERAERELIKKLLAFPGEVAEAADRRAPHRIAAYALELAQAFTAFYRDCQVVGVEPVELKSFRIALSVVSQRVIARSLGLLGVDAPASM
ncbi:MAG: arginine--tRNA ligase [Solirubrobacterales bacterium]|nr:arginine--tRNA ligase [Solirubrobacterales bacterium]